jgi:hypothetical protein
MLYAILLETNFMKRLIISIVVLLTFLLNVKAQISEEVSKLTPYSTWLQKQSNETKKVRNIDYVVFIKPSRIRIKFETETKTLKTGQNVVSITAKTTTDEIVFQDVDKKVLAQLNYFGRIISKDKIIDGVFEEQKSVEVTVENLTNSFPVIFEKTFELPKGKYTLYFRVTDVFSGNYTIKKIKFEIK